MLTQKKRIPSTDEPIELEPEEIEAAKALSRLDDRFRKFLPAVGVPTTKGPGITLGISKKTELPVGIDPSRPFRITVAASSDSGKSFLANRIVNLAIQAGYGVVVLDIRGEYRECNIANRDHRQFLMPYEIPRGMPDVVQLVPQYCRRDLGAARIDELEETSIFYSLAPSQMPEVVLRRLLSVKEVDPSYYMMENVQANLGTKDYTANDLKAEISELPMTETDEAGKDKVVFQPRTKSVLLNKIRVMERKGVISNRFLDFRMLFRKHNAVFNFMYSTDDYITKIYVATITNTLYRLAMYREIGRPMLLVVDEADLMLERFGYSKARTELERIVKLGRLYNVSTLFISQTPSLLPPLILSQSNYMIVGPLRDPEDAGWVCKSRGMNPPHMYRDIFTRLECTPERKEFVLLDSERGNKPQHFYAKSCLSKHAQPFKTDRKL